MNALLGFFKAFKFGFYARCFFAALYLLMKKTTIRELLSSPLRFLGFPIFLGLQSFLFKLCLCIMRRLRQKSDDDGVNPFVSGVVSGLSFLLVSDPTFRKLLALYMMVRAFKVFLDIQQAKGKITQQQIEKGSAVIGVALCMWFPVMYVLDFDLWPEKSWQLLSWIFQHNNQPNDRIYRDILRKRL